MIVSCTCSETVQSPNTALACQSCVDNKIIPRTLDSHWTSMNSKDLVRVWCFWLLSGENVTNLLKFQLFLYKMTSLVNSFSRDAGPQILFADKHQKVRDLFINFSSSIPFPARNNKKFPRPGRKITNFPLPPNRRYPASRLKISFHPTSQRLKKAHPVSRQTYVRPSICVALIN